MSPRPPRSLRRHVALAAVIVAAAGLTTASCGAKFDPSYKLKTLRILAVKKENVTYKKALVAAGKDPGELTFAYGRPGDVVHFEMLMFDGKSPVEAQRPVIGDGPTPPAPAGAAGPVPYIAVDWIPGCHNPAGDLYYGCYAQFAELAAKIQPIAGRLDGGAPIPSLGTALPHGLSFDYAIPGTIISERPPPPNETPYGLSYVFFTACAGYPALATPGSDAPFPLVCLDDDGNAQGPDQFVPGFTAVYSYEADAAAPADDTANLRMNANPIVTDLLFDGAGLSAAPGGGADAGDAGAGADGGASDGVHVARCEGDPANCQPHTLKPIVDPSSAQPDPGATSAVDGTPLSEQMWVNLYASDGDLAAPAKLVNDATRGWNADTQTTWTPPPTPGAVMLWAVVHDNRGGTAWISRKVIVD